MPDIGKVSFFCLVGRANEGHNNTVTTNDGIQLRLNYTYRIINLIIIAEMTKLN